MHVIVVFYISTVIIPVADSRGSGSPNSGEIPRKVNWGYSDKKLACIFVKFIILT